MRSLEAESAPEPRRPPAFTTIRPIRPAAPILFASPHSGREYPEDMQADLRVPLIDLRRTEDAFVDELFADAPGLGATLISAVYARGYVDLNRDSTELDPAMFADGAPRPAAAGSTRVEAGLGCLPKVAARGEPIYARRLTRAEGEERLAQVHDAYHCQLDRELSALRASTGRAILVDCHSMPSSQPGRRRLDDVVLGDRFGSSCDNRLTMAAERAFRALGYSVARNTPYAGGYTTRRYGRPQRGLHAIQVEINRALYMDESRVVKRNAFDRVRRDIANVCGALIAFAAETA
ncbi:MAG: N-formylglutamate amidohydrolase [Pseudomonadota bacterium]